MAKGRGKTKARGTLEALAHASFDELKARHPDEWQRTGEALLAALRADKAAGAKRFLDRVRAEAAPWQARLAASGGNPAVLEAALPALVRARLGELAVERAVAGTLAKAGGGSTRVGWWTGLVAQRLFFERGLRRKPVSLRWFRLLWPLCTRKAALMPLLARKGIYCFYSDALLRALAAAIGDQPALEIAAGDGTLARLLRAAGADVRATDDGSWSHVIERSDEVERLDARAALKQHRPRVVLCGWPPPGNAFEAHVFSTPTVDRYIVLTTRHQFAAGAWDAYADAKSFELKEDAALSRLVLPPEVDPVVLVWTRRKSA